MKKMFPFIYIITVIIFIMGCSQAGSTLDSAQTGHGFSGMSPSEILGIAFSALKDADGETFNDCVVYPGEKNKNVYFGDDLSDDDGYIEMLFEKLSYKVLQTDEQEDSTSISCEISNKNLADLDLVKYSEEDNPMVAAIGDSKKGIITKKIKIKFVMADNQWKILIDEDFTTAITGGHWGNSIMSRIWN